MIVIDTNVVSELMRAAPSEAVLDWFGRHDAGDLHVSAVTEAELRRGVAILPEGRRREALADAVDATITEDFAGRVLAFDGPAAVAFAAVFAERRAIGRPTDFPDCLIAATARTHGATVATREVERFEGCALREADTTRARLLDVLIHEALSPTALDAYETA